MRLRKAALGRRELASPRPHPDDLAENRLFSESATPTARASRARSSKRRGHGRPAHCSTRRPPASPTCRPTPASRACTSSRSGRERPQRRWQARIRMVGTSSAGSTARSRTRPAPVRALRQVASVRWCAPTRRRTPAGLPHHLERPRHSHSRPAMAPTPSAPPLPGATPIACRTECPRGRDSLTHLAFATEFAVARWRRGWVDRGYVPRDDQPSVGGAVRAKPHGDDLSASGYRLAIRRSTRSSLERKGSLQRTVRWAWSLSFRWTQSTV